MWNWLYNYTAKNFTELAVSREILANAHSVGILGDNRCQLKVKTAEISISRPSLLLTAHFVMVTIFT